MTERARNKINPGWHETVRLDVDKNLLQFLAFKDSLVGQKYLRKFRKFCNIWDISRVSQLRMNGQRVYLCTWDALFKYVCNFPAHLPRSSFNKNSFHWFGFNPGGLTWIHLTWRPSNLTTPRIFRLSFSVKVRTASKHRHLFPLCIFHLLIFVGCYPRRAVKKKCQWGTKKKFIA